MHLVVLPGCRVHRMLEESGRGSAQSHFGRRFAMPFQELLPRRDQDAVFPGKVCQDD